MKIENIRVHGLEESIIASRYPMMIQTPDEYEFTSLAEGLQTIVRKNGDYAEIERIFDENKMEDEKWFMNRAEKLGRAKQGSGHNNFLLGIIVQMDITASQTWWLQQSRYHFADIVSSQSKMHRLTKMDIDQQCNKWVSQESINSVKALVYDFNNFDELKKVVKTIELRDETTVPFTKENIFNQIIYTCPTGLNLTARVSDNYLSIKTEIEQREHHKLYEWREYCEVMKELPYFEQLTGIKNV